MRLVLRLVLAVALLTLVAAACSNDDGDGAVDAAVESTVPPDELAVTTSTANPEPVGEHVTRYDLELGECFNVYNALNLITRVPCEQPHDREVFHTESHPAPHGEPFPGERAMQRYALGVCYRQFEAFTGGLYEVSRLEIGAFTPTQQNFEDSRARYRGITCWLHARGEQLTGSVRGLGI